MSLPLFLAAQIEDTFLKVRECSSDSDIARDCFSLRFFFSGKVKNLSGLNFTFFAVYFWFLFKFSLFLCLKEGKLHNRTTKVYEIVSKIEFKFQISQRNKFFICLFEIRKFKEL